MTNIQNPTPIFHFKESHICCGFMGHSGGQVLPLFEKLPWPQLEINFWCLHSRKWKSLWKALWKSFRHLLGTAHWMESLQHTHSPPAPSPLHTAYRLSRNLKHHRACSLCIWHYLSPDTSRPACRSLCRFFIFSSPRFQALLRLR